MPSLQFNLPAISFSSDLLSRAEPLIEALPAAEQDGAIQGVIRSLADGGVSALSAGGGEFRLLPGWNTGWTNQRSYRPAVIGGLAPYSFALDGTLPTGWTLDSQTGEISGAADYDGASVSIDVTDALGQTISILAPLPLDVTAPTLSSAAALATSGSTADLSVSTNEGNGTLYWYVSTSGTAPSVSDLMAGTGSASFGNEAVSTTGLQTASATGLSGETSYYAHFYHVDAAGNGSSIATSSSFTTPINLGPELVTNGAFDSDTAWNKGTGWTIAGGKGVATSVPAFQDIDQAVAITNGTQYFVSIDVVVSAGTASLYMGTSGHSPVRLALNSSGTLTATLTATAVAAVLVRAESGGFTGTIDNISIKEVL